MAEEKGKQTSANVLGDNLKPKSKEPDTSLNPNIENTKVLTENFGEFKGLNPYHVKKRLLDDSELFDKTAKKYFIESAGGSGNIKKQFQDDPQALNQQFETFKKNFRKDLHDSSYSGETIDDTLINRSVELSDDPEKINPDSYLSTIRKNQKKYEKMGLVKDDGTLLYEGEEGSFGHYLTSNDDLHRELQKDRFKEFEEELSKQHNQVAGLDDPSTKTKAWVVYDKKGSEGLTDFINGLQDETINEQFDEGQYLNRSSVGDKNLSQYYKEFVVGEVKDTKFGEDIAEIAYKYDLDPSMLSGLVEQESSFNPNATSKTGAVGISQLQPATAREYGLKVPDELYELDKKRINARDQRARDMYARQLREATKQTEKDPESDERYNPQKALEATGKYLSDTKKKHDNDDMALAAYHAGNRGLERAIESGDWEEAVPDSTKDYVQKVNENRAKYEEKSDNGLVFQPEKPRKDITKPIPKDLNKYTVQFYNKDGNTKKLKTSIEDYVSQHVPQNVASEFDKSTFMRDGPLSDEYRQVVSSVYKRAIEGNEYDFKDLLNTVYANAEQGKIEGEDYYEIDYNKVDWPVRQAFDAIRMNPETNTMVKDEGDGKYRIVPNMDKIALRANKKVRDMLYSTETELVRNEDGSVDFKEVPDKGFFSQIWNSGVNLMMGGSNFAMKYAGKPLFQGLNDLTDGDVDWIRDSKEAVEAASGITLSELSSAEEDGWMPNAVEEVAPMFWYMASMWGMGGAVKKGIGKSMQLFSKMKAGGDTMRLGKMMDGASKFSRMGEAIEQSSNPAMNFYAGGAALEALTPKKDSFYNVIPQLFGEGQDNEVSKFYNASNIWTRKAMDVGASLMLDLGIDTIIGAGRFAKDHVAKQFFDKNKFQSYEYAPKVEDGELGGVYKMKDTPTFTHEIRTFYNEIANGLAEKPIGNVGNSLAKNLSKNENINTLHDAVKRFSDQAGPVASDMKGQVREHIESLQERFARGRGLSDDQLDELVETQYQHFIDSSAKNIHNILKTADDKSLPIKFAQVLEEQVPTSKQFKIAGDPVKPNQAPRWIDKGKNLVVKDDKVFEVDPKFWTVDMAKSLRKLDLDKTAEEVGERKIRESGIDPKVAEGQEFERVAEIRNEAENTIGQPTVADGKMGYVTDYSDEGFTVRTADGEVTKKSLKSDLTEQEINDNFVKGLARDFVKKRQPVEELTRTQQQRLLPEPDYSRQERQFLEQINEAESEISGLQQRHQNLDTIVDDGQRRGQMKHEITQRIKDLRGRKKDLQRDLSKVYKDNPQLQKARVQDKVKSDVGQELNMLQQQRIQSRVSQFAKELDRMTKVQSKLPYC